MTNPSEPTGQPSRLQKFNDGEWAQPAEPTGQQQMEALKQIIASDARLTTVEAANYITQLVACDTQIALLKAEIKVLKERQPWREISVDGLPGEGDADTMFVLRLQDDSYVLSNRREIIHWYGANPEAITHYLQIDLP